MWRIYDDGFSSRGNAFADSLPVDAEAGTRQRNMDFFTTVESNRWVLTVESRIEHNHFIAIANQGLNRHKERLSGAGGDGDF